MLPELQRYKDTVKSVWVVGLRTDLNLDDTFVEKTPVFVALQIRMGPWLLWPNPGEKFISDRT